MEPPILFDPKVHSYLIPSLAAAHASAILNPPFMIATFIPPLKQDVMQAWWEDRAKEVAAGQRHIIMQLAPNATTGEKEVVGLVALAMPVSETGPFRGYVEKLIVVHEHRRKGIAKALMLKMEEAALKEGRTLLVRGY
jgi:ribosomal protein S18 acetylase RimI-like enzyme